MSDSHQQVWIAAPVRIVWELIADLERHPEWWPRVVHVECEGLEEGCQRYFRAWVTDSLAAVRGAAVASAGSME